MGKALTRQTFNASGSWTAPAGVTRVAVQTTKDIPDLIGGGQSTLFRDPDGYAFSVGTNANGQLGDGSVVTKSSPVAVAGGLQFFKLFNNGAGAASCLAMLQTGQMYGFGLNGNGQLGLGDVTPRSSPVAVVGGLLFADFVSNSSVFSVLAMTKNGIAYSWGVNTAGQLGLGDVVPRSSPVAVLGGFLFRSIVAGDAAFYGITTTGAAVAWGINTLGQLGDGSAVAKSSPVAVAGGLSFSRLKSSGVGFNAYGLTSTGATVAWGDNTFGQLGDGSSTSRNSPVTIVGGLLFADVFTNGNTSFGITFAGKLYSWGQNNFGDLGDGTTVVKSSPVAVVGGLLFKSFFCDNNIQAQAYFGLTFDNVLYGWGDNRSGQLGDGTVLSRSSPVAVLGGLLFKKLFYGGTSAGGAAIQAVTSTGRFYSWGSNSNGQLALGDVVPRSSPVAMLGSFAGSAQTITSDNWLDVVPGTAYAISLDYFPSFGGTVLTQLPATQIIVNYMQ